LGQFNPNTGVIQEFKLPLGDQTGMGSYMFSAGPDGNIWLDYWTSHGHSVGEFDPRTGAIQEGLSSSYAFAPGIHGPDGHFWVLGGGPLAGESYLGETNPTTGVVTNVFQLSRSAIGLAATTDGKMWILLPTKQIVEFDPSTGLSQIFDVASPTATPTTGMTSSSNNSISATATNVSASAGIDFTTAVATFTPQTSISSTGQAYQATIDWGDGTTSSLVLAVAENATYDVTAGHTYQKAGTYSIKVTLGNYNPANPLGDNAVTVFSTANVQAFDFKPFN